jgi:glycosyltransferase involved in cell wall biosynthesis
MFRDHFRRSGADVVFVVTAALPAALVGARLARVPSIVYAAEILQHRGSHGRASAAAAGVLVRLTGRLATTVVATSRAVAGQYAGARARVTVIYPGFSAPPEADGRSFRSHRGLEGAAPLLAVVGNVTHGRGQDVAIRAVKLLTDRFPEVACVIVGGTLSRAADDAYRESLYTLAGDLGVSSRVVFTGVVERIFDVYAAADVVVNPARVPEGLGRAALEALAAGKPVVSTRVGAVPEILRDQVDALLVEPDAAEAIADAVATLWSDEELRDSLVRRGRERVSTKLDERRSAQAFREVVDEVVASSSRGSSGNAQVP